jgi:hypothetical protein
MRSYLSLLAAVSAVLLSVACSSSDSNSSGSQDTDGGTAGTGGSSGSDSGTAGTGGSSGSDSGTAGTGGSSGSDSGTAGSGGTAGSTGTPTCDSISTKTIASLSSEELGVACDCAVANMGGYNKTQDCGGGDSASTYKDQAACFAKLPTTCTVTTDHLLKCATAQGKDLCGTAADSDPDCTAFINGCF